MSKRELLITTLQQLQPSRNLAEGFLALLTSDACTEETENQIITFLANGIRTVNNKQQQSVLQNNLHQLETLRAQEKQLQQQDAVEAEDLLAHLD